MTAPLTLARIAEIEALLRENVEAHRGDVHPMYNACCRWSARHGGACLDALAMARECVELRERLEAANDVRLREAMQKPLDGQG